MKRYIVNEETILAVLNYLSDRPFKEVARMISALQMPQVTEYVEPAPTEPEESKE